MVPIGTEQQTVSTEITTLLIRNSRKPFSTQTSRWNLKVGSNTSFGGTAKASTGSLIEVMNAQMIGIRLRAVKAASATNRMIWVRCFRPIKTRLGRGGRPPGS